MATKIKSRFIFDSFFFEETLKGNFELQRKLTYITSKASGNKKKQNVISEKSRELILTNNPNINIEIVRIFLNKENVKTFENIGDEVERVIRYAIYLTSSPPYKVIIFTSTDKVDEYKANSHYQKMKNITVIAVDDAIAEIEYWHTKCREERLSSGG